MHIKGIVAALHFLVAALVAWSLFAAEADPRLVEFAKEKQRLEEQAERGRLLIENAQLRYNELVAKEKAVQAESTKKAEK